METRKSQCLQSRQVTRASFESLENRRLLSFSPAVNYATIGTPSAIVTADLNNDGKLDLVTCANAVTGSFSVFLGNGAGGFGAAQRTVMGTQLTSLAAADFNNDGKLDLVVSDNYDYGFDFLAGKGDGTFQPPVYTQSGAVAAVGRFNGDSYTDVLISRLGPDWEIQFQVYCGDGQGGFAAVGTDLWYYGSGRAAVDLNNDGKLDVVTAEGYVFPGNGDGTFQFDWEQPALLDGGEIATGDFTGDGKVDAIVAGNNKVSVLRGRGDGTFDAPITQAVAGNPHTGIATADFNGDGKLDAVVSADNTGAVRLMLGNGDGTLRDAGLFATGSGPSGVVAGDFNRDGRPDVAVSNAVSRTVSVLLNDGAWGMKTYVGPANGSWSTSANWSPTGAPGASDSVTIADKAVNLGASATVASLTLTGGAALNLAANGSRVFRASSIAITGTNSKLNLNDNDLIVDSGNFATLQSLVLQGFTSNGSTGITSATSTGSQLLALLDNTTVGLSAWSGQNIPPNAVLGKYTYFGDCNLDGQVNAGDYSIIDANYNSAPAPGTAWIRGDLNLDGIVNASDYGIIDANYNRGVGNPLSPANVIKRDEDRFVELLR